MRRFLLALTLTATLAIASPASLLAQEVVFVYDGDSFQADIGALTQNIRLIGIECAEGTPSPKARREAKRLGITMKEYLTHGDRASAFTRSLLPKGSKFRIEYDKEKRDKYGRLLAYVFLPDGRLLNEEILKAGHGDLFRSTENIKYKARLETALDHAKKNRLGMWAK